jgi:hypothetical protein
MLAGMSKVIVTPAFIDLEHPAILRAMLDHILEHAHVVGRDRRGREIMRFEFAAEPWMVDKLASSGAAQAELEDGDDDMDEVE